MRKQNNNLKKIMCALLCVAIILTFPVSAYSYKMKPEHSLEIPESAVSFQIREDTFEDFFEVIEIYEEKEVDISRFSTVQLRYEGNVTCKAQGILSHFDLYDLENSYAELNKENDLWLLSPDNVRKYTPLNEGPYEQVTGIYDQSSQTLYYSSVDSSIGYAFSNFRENGLVSVTKFDIISFGNPTIYKITRMIARFKKLPYITVSYNNELISFDQKPITESGRTLVPLRAIFEKIGAEVEWNEETQTVTATKDNTSISLTINNKEAIKNGQSIALDVPAKVVNDRTLVPVRFVADCFGVDVQWNEDIKRVILKK